MKHWALFLIMVFFFSSTTFAQNGGDTLFRDAVKLDPGCYEFRLSDKIEDGMNRHWWYRNENPDLMGKNGKIEFHDVDGNTIRKFPYDFGQEILYRFSVKE